MRRNAKPPDAPAEETRPGAPDDDDGRQPPTYDDRIDNGDNGDGRQPPAGDDHTSNGNNAGRQPPANDGGINDGDDGGSREPWYSWNRWKYIGGALFLVISVAGVSYVIWDTIDLLPRPVTIETIRAALRVSPGRITDVVALAGLFSFGPPAGVDLMFGAKKAADGLYQRMRREDKARWKAEGHAEGRVEGHVEGHAEGRAEERKNMIAQLRARANGNPELLKLLDEVENGD